MMSRLETATTAFGAMLAAMGSHILCCGILPMAVNGSLQAAASHLGLQLGLAVLTTLAIATVVTLWERRRHAAICQASSHDHFRFEHHLLRNIVIGFIAYGFFTFLTHVPMVHHGLEHLLGL